MELMLRILFFAYFVLINCYWDYRHKTAYKRCSHKVWECKDWMCVEYDRCDCHYCYRDVI